MRAITACAVGAALSLSAAAARAEEPVAASEPRLMSETAEITSVVDAFEKDDPFDLHLTLGFSQMWKSASIRRETALFQGGLSTGGFVAQTENVARFNQSLSILNVGADVGIYKDLALVFRLPVILSDSRELTDLNGSSNRDNAGRRADPTGAEMFPVPFKSPTRSGIDWFSLGLDYAIFNQQRDRTKPTWVVGVEGRFGIGPALHACNENAAVKCPDPVNPAVSRDPGISRAMNSIGAHIIVSKRFGYVEPYSGLWFLAELPQNRGDFGATGNLRGSLLNRPPLLGSFVMGLEVIPFEQKETFQRFIADFRFRGTYHSPGREYSELFDALGSSQAPTLRNPVPAAYMRDPAGTTNSVADPSSQKVYFAGITDQQAYGSVGVSTSATWQAGEYIKFTAGVGLQWNQSHLITSADACNPDFKNNPDASGPCRAVTGTGEITGIPNPNHRAVIDLPGRRFSVDDATIVNLWVMGVLMF
jgi:hypothetical protein